MNMRLIGSAVAALLLSACVGTSTPPKFQALQPDANPANGYLLHRVPVLDNTDHMVGHLDKDRNILYSQRAGGGGLALGLLLGPLGVMANVKLIESKTMADIELLSEKVNVMPRALFTDAVQKNGLVLGTSPQSTRASPYLYIIKGDDDKLSLLSALIMESAGPEKWAGWYQYQLPLSYTVTELASLDAGATRTLQEAAASGFDSLVKHLLAEKKERLDQEQLITYRSRVISPAMDIELWGALIADEGDMVWIRNPGGVYALRKAGVTYQLSK